jgi:hypothetical protein
MNRVANSIFELVGLKSEITSPVEKRLFVMEKPMDLKKINSRVSTIHIDITFLEPSIFGKDSKIYRRGQDNAYEYFLSEPSLNIEKLISVEEYINLKGSADKSRKVLHKDMKYFYHNNHYYCLSNVNGMEILETSLEKGRTLDLPDGEFKEVSQNLGKYSDYNLAKN